MMNEELKKRLHWYYEKGNMISVYNEETKKWEWIKADNFFPK